MVMLNDGGDYADADDGDLDLMLITTIMMDNDNSLLVH